MTKRLLVIGVVLMTVLAVGAFAATPLKIQAMWGYWNDPTPPADRTLVDYATKLIVDKTGVDCEWPILPQDWTTQQAISAFMAAGTLPQVLDVGALWIDSEWAKFITTKNMAYEITPAMVKQYMPNFTKRAQQYGRTVEELMAANTYQGKNLSIPTQFGFASFPKLQSNEAAKQPGNDYYAIAFRDDILKMIFPNARTEKDLQDLLVKNGQLTTNDIIGDIPIKNLDDLYQYLKKVKALNLKVGDKPVIPGAITASSESMGALDWSLRTIVGFAWDYPFMMGTPPDFADSVYPKATPEYKAYMAWWNKLYNEGLIDPEMFVMKNDQFNAKQINGEYAVINRWWYVGDAEKVGKDRGYGYRFFPVFFGQLKPNLLSNNIQYVSLQGGCPVAITKSAKQADVPKIMKWVDWYMSEERDSLAYWGMPDWYSGTGKDRRYTWQHASLEDWALYGINYTRDGLYYGLEHAYPATYNPIKSVKFPLGVMGFFGDSMTYPDAPYFVYPKDPKKVLQTTNLWNYTQNVIRAARWDQFTVFTTATSPYADIMGLPEVAAWDTDGSNDPNYTPVIVKMITGASADFEKNYQAFYNMIENWGGPNGANKALQAEINFWKKFYKEQVVPKQINK